MLAEAILGLVIVALLLERHFSNRSHAEEVARLTSAVIVKNAGELRMVDEMWTAPKEPAYTPPQPVIPEGYEGQAGLS